MRKQLLLALIAIMCHSSDVFAAKPYRCDGKVQFRPCDFKFTGRDGSSMVRFNTVRNTVPSTVRLTVAPEQLAKITGVSNILPVPKLFSKTNSDKPAYQVASRAALKPASLSNPAQILTPRMKRLPKARGLWEGVVKGVGEISLNLLIFRNGALESSRFMGRVILDRPKSTTFAFNSALPKGQGWEWTIVADAAA